MRGEGGCMRQCMELFPLFVRPTSARYCVSFAVDGRLCSRGFYYSGNDHSTVQRSPSNRPGHDCRPHYSLCIGLAFRMGRALEFIFSYICISDSPFSFVEYLAGILMVLFVGLLCWFEEKRALGNMAL